MQTQRIQFLGTGAAVFVVMAALAPSANGQTVTSPRNPAGSMSVGMLQLEQQRAGTAPLKIRDWAVPVSPQAIRFRIPAQCPSCAAKGSVVPETTIHGESVTLTWLCRTCDHEWPITADEQQVEHRKIPKCKL